MLGYSPWVCTWTLHLEVEIKTIELSSRQDKEIGSNNLLSEKEKQEIIYKTSGNYNIQRSSNAYVPFNSLNFSEGNMPVYDLNTENVGESIIINCFVEYDSEN